MSMWNLSTVIRISIGWYLQEPDPTAEGCYQSHGNWPGFPGPLSMSFSTEGWLLTILLALKELIVPARHWLIYIYKYAHHKNKQTRTTKTRQVWRVYSLENREMQVDNSVQTWPLGGWWQGRLGNIGISTLFSQAFLSHTAFTVNITWGPTMRRACVLSIRDEEKFPSQHTVCPPFPRVLKQQIKKKFLYQK